MTPASGFVKLGDGSRIPAGRVLRVVVREISATVAPALRWRVGVRLKGSEATVSRHSTEQEAGIAAEILAASIWPGGETRW